MLALGIAPSTLTALRVLARSLRLATMATITLFVLAVPVAALLARRAIRVRKVLFSSLSAQLALLASIPTPPL